MYANAVNLIRMDPSVVSAGVVLCLYQVGDWRNHFSPEQSEWFESLHTDALAADAPDLMNKYSSDM